MDYSHEKTNKKISTKTLTKKCDYVIAKDGYISGCGMRAAYNKFWIFCPYCGKQIVVINQKYNEE